MAEIVQIPRPWESKEWVPTDESMLSGFLFELRINPDLDFAYVGKQWLVYRNGLWRPDETDELGRAIGAFQQKVGLFHFKKTPKTRIEKHSTHTAIKSRVTEELSYASDAFDAKPHWVAFPSSMYDCELDCFFPHKKEYLTSRCCAVDPDENCPAYLWDKILKELIPDEALRAHCYRFWGYSLTGFTKDQIFMFMFGPGGTGKSTLLDVVYQLLGDYAAALSVGFFAEKKQDKHPAELAQLRGKRFVIGSETGRGYWNETLLKQFVGGDPMTANLMHQNPSTYRPAAKLAIAGNAKPRINDTASGAILRRMQLIPMLEKIAQINKEIGNDLKEEYPGIMAKLIQGLRDYMRIGLDPPDIVKEETQQYMDEQDLVGQWLEEAGLIAYNSDGSINHRKAAATGQLFKYSWMPWCEDHGIHPGDSITLGQTLAMMRPRFLYSKNVVYTDKGRIKRGRGFKGLWLPPERSAHDQAYGRD